MRTPEHLEAAAAPRNPHGTRQGRYLYLEALLQGGAPWGFTLKGGLERGEPLIISKIEEGGKADLVSSRLRAGDEVVHINEVVLSSSRREAVSLVKGSYKTLRLVVRRDACAAPGPAGAGTSDRSPEPPASRPQHRKAAWWGEAKRRPKHRRSDPARRPHSWHLTKFGENQPDASMMQITPGTIGAPWPQRYHSSSSTSDLSNLDRAYLRPSPDRCSSQGSMESLEPGGGSPPCPLLSPAKSTSSIDQLGHLHSKRDSAYSSFSTSSSLLEYPPAGLPGRERSSSMDATAARGGLLEGMRQADIRYVKTVYDPRRGVSAEYEVNSSALLLQGREARASADGRGCDKWHHVARGKGAAPPSCSQPCPSALETPPAHLPPPKVGAPLPPARSDSYAAFRQRERPGSWSSLDQKRFCRPQASPAGPPKSPFLEEQLRPVLERSPENSPPAQPKQGYAPKAQPGQPLLPTGVYPVPSPEPHFAQVPRPSASGGGSLYPALAKESGCAAPPGACDRMAPLDQNGNHDASNRPGFAFYQPLEHDSVPPVERRPETSAKYVPYKVHFPSVPENEEEESPERPVTPLGGDSPHPGERRSAHSSKPSSNFHSLRCPPAWHVGEDQCPARPPEPWEADLHEDHSASLLRGLQRDSLGRSPSSSFGRTQAAFSSLQNIPESLRRQSSLELGGGAGEGYLEGWSTSVVNSKVEGSGRRAVPEHRSHPDRPVSYPRRETRPSAVASFPGADPRCGDPPSPPHLQPCGLGRRLSSGTCAPQGSQHGRPPCSVLEKVSQIERREHGGPGGPRVSGSSYGHSRTLATPNPFGHDFEETKGRVRLSDSADPTGNGEQHSRPHEPKPGEASGQPHGQPRRRGAEGGRGPRPAGGEPPRRDPALPRSQSTCQLRSEAGREPGWPEPRPGSPEWPAPDAPFSRAYRNSIKDAQCRVLGATSFRRRDLELGPPAASRPWRPRPASAHVGLRSPEAAASPHSPRERHSVTPADGDPARPAPPAARRGPRRRLTPEQKKRSYSEPDKMNEVGVAEEAAPARLSPRRPGLRLPESSVADRRRVFERDGRACSALCLSGPELKQFQQSALADYVQRKTGQRPPGAAGCGLQEPRERVQGAHPQPGLAPAASLCSLREPAPQPRRDAAPLPATAPGAEGDTARAPRDRSGSFAGGRLPAERRRGDQAPREQLGGASHYGPKGAQRVDRTPGEPSLWGAAARRAGKSMSAEDLLERSDSLAVPVHVRSRSSPTADQRQDVVLGENSSFGLMKDPCYSAAPGPRSLGCSEKGGEDTPLLRHHPSPRWGGPGYKAIGGASVPSKCPGPLDPQRQASGATPRPGLLPTAVPGHPADTRAAPRTPLGSALPSPAPWSSQAAADRPAGRDGQTGQQPLPPHSLAVTHRSNGHSLVQPASPRGHEPNSPEPGTEGATRRRVSQPPWPAPPRVKCAPAAGEPSREHGRPEASPPPERASPQRYRAQQPPPSSGSAPDRTPPGTPSAPGRISLRISESALRASPPAREDDEDDVFVRDSDRSAASSPAFELPAPPPPPRSQDPPADGLDDFPPPPPQAVCAPAPGSEAPKGPRPSSSKFAEVTVAKGGSVPGTVHSAGRQTPASGSQTSVEGSEANESNPPSSVGALPQPDGALGQQPSPGQPPPINNPVCGTQGLENNVSSGSQKSSEDIRTEALAKEIVHQDKSLADILDPDSRLKTTMDLMAGLFPRDGNLRKENSAKRKAAQRTVTCSGDESKRGEDREAVGVLVNCPAYYRVSAPKAELLNKIKDMPADVSEEGEQVDVNEKKAELIGSLTHKLETLREAKGSLLMDIKLNNALGEEVEALIRELCKPNEFDKYKMFIGDLDKVVNLLLSLSGRLARVENVLSGLGEDASREERSSLSEKRKVLAGQHEDARELKENLDRRERVVLDILANYLSEEQLQDYQHFVKMKSTLLIEQRKLDDKIKLGQEQVKCLLESLPSDFIPKAGALALPPDLESETAPAGAYAVSGLFPALTSPL
ncbi:LOW QUALITY PROTEIN: protein Shroom3 [Meles meles]|uniref:LOW QUALITY PROTEIN: protein Shroom3 n=1 Tax=Meles meles TaxID=9662 RepID=UPI001E699276|nr:LOW QUALITY PROTEIN: protein Shroom3 [Meles meles]